MVVAVHQAVGKTITDLSMVQGRIYWLKSTPVNNPSYRNTCAFTCMRS